MIRHPWKIGLFVAGAFLFSGAWPEPHASAGASSAVRYTHSLHLKPTGVFQRRTFLLPATRAECQAIERTHPELRGRACTMSVSIEMGTRNEQPFSTGGTVFLRGPHVRTGYAAISLCVSGPSLAGVTDCNSAIGHCLLAGLPPRFPQCYPAWNARVSTMFQYNGREVRRIWLDPSLMGEYGFVVHATHSFTRPRSSRGVGHIVVDETLTVTGSMPTTRPVHAVHVPRMTIYPDGSVTYSAS